MVLKWKSWNIGSACLGLILVVFSLIWLLVIFPPLSKLPADHHEVLYFEGTYIVMNPQTQSLDEIPVNVKREQQAADVQGNVLMIDQTITATHAQAGMELPEFGLTEVLGVDRSTRQYVSGYGDMDRSGQFGFPERVEKKDYSLWMPAAGRPLEARFTGEEEFRGLKVLTFEVSEHDLDIGTQTGSDVPQVLDIDVDMKVEPVSGTTVRSESNVTIKAVPMPAMKVPVHVSSLTFTDDTIADLVDTAGSARTTLLWCRVYGFWLGIGLGIVLMGAGALGAIRTRPS